MWYFPQPSRLNLNLNILMDHISISNHFKLSYNWKLHHHELQTGDSQWHDAQEQLILFIKKLTRDISRSAQSSWTTCHYTPLASPLMAWIEWHWNAAWTKWCLKEWSINPTTLCSYVADSGEVQRIIKESAGATLSCEDTRQQLLTTCLLFK